MAAGVRTRTGMASEVNGRLLLVGAVVVAAAVGVVAAPTVADVAAGTTPAVAVVEVEGPVVGSLADDVERELRAARNNDSVEAVVLKMDTPGGAPVASERMYMSVQRTAAEMPVVASVQEFSASGGYYTMLPADAVYVLPTSITGSVGLAAGAPRPAPPVRGPSGPNKRGGTVVGTWATQETLADSFIDTVMSQRGDRIQVPRSEVAKAKTYLGTAAVRNGFADEIGSLDEAVRAAADRAGLERYRIDVRETGSDTGLPLLVRAEGTVLAVYDEDPGFGDVRPLGPSYVYEGAVPHVDTIGAVTRAELPNNASAATGGERP